MKTNKFKMIPETLLLDENVTKNDLLVYVALAQFKNNKNGKAFPSIATIAKLARSSENTVRTALKHLAQLGYITISSRYDRATKSNKSNVYTLLNVDEKDVNSLLGSDIVEEVREVAKVIAPKKRIIRRKKATTTTRNPVGERSTTPTKEEKTAPAKKSPIVEKKVSISDYLEGVLEDCEEVTEEILTELGVECAEELDEAGAEYLDKALEIYVRGEGLLRFGLFYENALQTKLDVEDLRELHKLTGGNYEKAIEAVLTMKNLIKDNHKIHNKYTYLVKVLENGIYKKKNKVKYAR